MRNRPTRAYGTKVRSSSGRPSAICPVRVEDFAAFAPHGFASPGPSEPVGCAGSRRQWRALAVAQARPVRRRAPTPRSTRLRAGCGLRPRRRVRRPVRARMERLRRGYAGSDALEVVGQAVEDQERQGRHVHANIVADSLSHGGPCERLRSPARSARLGRDPASSATAGATPAFAEERRRVACPDAASGLGLPQRRERYETGTSASPRALGRVARRFPQPVD